MGLVSMAFASGYASGLNAYLTVLVLGLCGRFFHIAGIPEGFTRIDVLIVMGVLAVLEIVADKIPYLDSTWDTISTVIRPVAGAVIGALIGGAQGDLPTIALAAVGGVTALLSTLAKSSIRLAINTSPEPATNVTHSVINDVVATVVSIGAALFPVVAAVIALIALLASIGLAVVLFRRVRRGWRRLRAWIQNRRAPAPGAGSDGRG